MTQSYPKHTYLLVIAAVVALLCSCGKNNEKTSEEKAATDTANAIKTPITSTNQSELLKLVITPQGGDFRGFTFGDPLSKIKAEEKFELFEDSTNHVGYTHETENFEAIDILYYLDNNKALNGVRVDIYLNDANATQSLYNQFDAYLSGKYTPESKQAKKTTWKAKGGMPVSLEDVSKDKDFGLRLGIGAKGASPDKKSKPLQ